MTPHLLALCAACALSAPAAHELDFLLGDWAMRKDGFSFTVRVERALGGSAYRVESLLDENNRHTSTALLTRHPQSGRWWRTSFQAYGGRASFEQVDEAEGVALELRSVDGAAVEPVRARIVYLDDGEAGFRVDWQSRAEASAPWEPRAVPLIHRPVERPAPPPAPGRIAFVSDRGDNWDIYTMDPDGSALRQPAPHEAVEHAAHWIAGGRRLAFLSMRDGEGWTRYEVDRDGSDLERVPLPEGLGQPDAGSFPQVHPSGSYLVYAAEREGEQDLYVCRFDGGGERVLAPAPGLDYRPRWSPDGRRVLFVSERDGNAELYSVGIEGDDLQRLTDNPGIDRYGRWSPDGAHIAFASARGDDEDLELYTMRADGGELRRWTDNEGEDGEPSWSPDGARIAFRSNLPGAEPDSWNPEIFVLELASGELQNLTRSPAYDGEPSWSPAAP